MSAPSAVNSVAPKASARADRPSRLGLTAFAVGSLQVLLVAWGMSRGYFYGDDFFFTALANESAMDRSWFLQSATSHFTPGGLAVFGLMGKVWPLQYGPTVVFFV